MCGGCTGTSGWRRACVLQIIGATNPTAAQPGSVRQKILADWQGGLRRIRAVARHGAAVQLHLGGGAALGLASEPNTGDNGVHASAGPLEGLRERMVRIVMPWCHSTSTIEYRSTSAFVAAPSPALARPGRKARQGPALRHRPATAPMRCGSANRVQSNRRLAACARRCGWERRSRPTRSGRWRICTAVNRPHCRASVCDRRACKLHALAHCAVHRRADTGASCSAARCRSVPLRGDAACTHAAVRARSCRGRAGRAEAHRRGRTGVAAREHAGRAERRQWQGTASALRSVQRTDIAVLVRAELCSRFLTSPRTWRVRM